MITLVLFFIIGVYSQEVLGGNSPNAKPRIFEPTIKAAFDDIIASLPDDPVNYEVLNISNKDTLFDGTLDLLNFTINGLKSTELLVGTVQVVGAKANITIRVPKLTLTTDYTADFVLLDLLPLYGEGSLIIDIDNLIISISSQVNTSTPDGIQLKNFVFYLDFDSFVFDLTGVYYSEEFSKGITNLIQSIFTLDPTFLSGALSPILQDLINSILKSSSTTTLSDHLKINQQAYKQALTELAQTIITKV